MFINNGKSLFSNIGLIVSLLILCVLLYISYNKCYIGSTALGSSLESFDCNPQDASCFLAPKNVRIKISGGNIKVNFSIDNASNNHPIKFIIILAQFDSNKLNTGNNQFYLSDETDVNMNTKTNHNICSIVNGTPICQYIFSNIKPNDDSGNIFYYKLGVSALYIVNGISKTSAYTLPYNITTSNKLFTLNTSVESQNSHSQTTSGSSTSGSSTYDNTIATADGQYELIKSQLGNYPDNLLLDSQTTNSNMLTDLIDKSMAQAIININVSTKGVPTNATPTNTISSY